MTVALNMSSKSFRDKVASAILAGANPADAVKEVRAQALAELAVKSAQVAASAAIFSVLKEEGTERQADFDLIEYVRLQHVARQADKAAGQKPRYYKPYVAMRLASAWKKAGWECGHCYATEKSLQELKNQIAKDNAI